MRASGGALSCRLCMATTFTIFTGFACLLVIYARNLPPVTTDTSKLSKKTLDDIVTGVWWSDRLENLIPHGFDETSDREWRKKCANLSVVGLVSNGECGYNKQLTFSDGSRACCRYRNNADQIQGDIFSFHLARQLGIELLPPTTLVVPNYEKSQWCSVKSQLTLSHWRQDRPVVVTRFVPGLEPATIPMPLRETGRRVHPVWDDLRNKSVSELTELVQWSDLIIFDYLTANLDRVVNNLYNRQWNENMMTAPAHNLVKMRSSGMLLFLDNESGLLHGYRLLEKYEIYHRAFLSSLCVFRRKTVERLRLLHYNANAGFAIQNAFDKGEIFANALPALPQYSRKILQERIARVHEHVKWCEKQYPIK